MRYSSAWLYTAAVVYAPFAVATIDNTAASAALTAAAVQLPAGSYTLTNVQTGENINYVQDGRQLFPGSSAAASLQFDEHTNGPYVRIAAGGKCLSAQWGYDEAGKGIGADHAGVLYTCAVGPSADPSSTVEKTKQWWLFVPAEGQSSNTATANLAINVSLDNDDDDQYESDQATNTTAEGCRKTKEWIQRHPQYVNGPRYHHTECASLLTEDQKAQLGFASHSRRARHLSLANRLNRRAAPAGGNTYNIITLDHLLDMPTRALTGTAKTIEGSQATSLEIFDASDALQQWVVTSS